METHHYEIIGSSLAGSRPVDEHTMASLAILGERLEHLKRLDSAFDDIEFSPHVKRLKRHSAALAVR